MSELDFDDINRERLVWLIQKRDSDVKHASYYQGRIDEFCAQNAIDECDYRDLALRPRWAMVLSD